VSGNQAATALELRDQEMPTIKILPHTCHVIIKEGFSSLTESDDDEDDLLDMAWGLTPQSRLSCQVKVANKDLVVELPKYTINHARENH